MTDKLLWAFALGNLVFGVFLIGKVGAAMQMAGL